MTDTRLIQTRLAAAGYNPGPVDGMMGPKTYRALFSFTARRDLGDVGAKLGAGADRYFPGVQITTPLRIAHFLAQAAHETGGFRYFTEIWGPTPAQNRYEGRRDLGNAVKGDGYRFRGRGIFQLTGRANYDAIGRRVGLALVEHPELAAEPDNAVKIACDYWHTHELNRFADADDIEAITLRINGGRNGLADRQAYLIRAKMVLI